MTRLALEGGTPTLDRTRHHRWPVLGKPEREAVVRVLDRGVLSGANAPEAVALEAELARFVRAEHCLLTHCGTSALHLALVAAGVRAGDHVIVPAYSFVATPLAVLHAGAIPIFVDVASDTGLIDVEQTRAAITRRTRAIMPVHVHGCPADMTPIMALATTHDLVVIEDAAQAHGATYEGRPVGTIGHAGAFSLQSSKNLGAGEGGLLVTNDRAIAEAANRLRNFGQDVDLTRSFDPERPLDGRRDLDAKTIGWMYRGNELTAAIARAGLEQLALRTEKCAANAQRLAAALGELPGVYPGPVPSDRTSVHHKFRVRLDPAAAGVDVEVERWREIVSTALCAEGLEVVRWQTQALPAQTLFQKREGFGGWPWSTDPDSDFTELYDPARFPRTGALLAGSLVLFSQSCPLIAQPADVVDAYIDAFLRVWQRRTELEGLTNNGRQRTIE